MNNKFFQCSSCFATVAAGLATTVAAKRSATVAAKLAAAMFLLFLPLCMSAQSDVDYNTASPDDAAGCVNPEFENVSGFMKSAMRNLLWRPQEKVYLHMDNTAYFKGETIWLKAYVTRTDIGRPTDMSKVLYVELLNPSGDVVERRKLKIDDGVAYGDIKVDSIVTTGFYEIRAFTRYMTNWGPNACFSRVIPIFRTPKYEGDYSNPTIDKLAYNKRLNNERIANIDVANSNIVEVNPDDDAETPKSAKPRQRRARFYPEGGDMIDGMPAKVAFTLADNDGMPLSEQCTVVDKQGAVVAQCHTDTNGYGCFTLAKAADGLFMRDGDGKRTPLPSPKDEGCTLAVDMMDDEKIVFDIRATQSLHGKLLGYVMINNGNVVRCDTLTASAFTERTLVRDKMPGGVTQMTLFDSDGRIMAERMFFICPRRDGSERIKVTTPTTTLKPCGKVKFSIEAQPNANLSFAAVDASGVVNGSHGNMYNWMLLSSELRGYIARPEYYFEADDLAHRRAADLLMLIQGWRRYDWNLITGQSTFMKYQPIEDKLYLFGRLRQKTKKGTVDNVWMDTKMYNITGQVVEGMAKTDSIGCYVFEVPELYGEWQLLINTGKADKEGYWQDMNYYVAIDRNFSPAGKYVSPLEAAATAIDTTRIFKWKFTEEDERWVGQLNRTRVLKNVTVTAKKRFWDRTNWSNETNAQKHSILYYNCDEHADRIADEGQDMPTLYEWLAQVNSFFSGTAMPDDGYSTSVDSNIIGTAGTIYNLTLEGKNIDDEGNPLTYYKGGLGYNNRPIVWILDNEYSHVTNLPQMNKIEVLWLDSEDGTSSVFPAFLDEAKSVYVSEDLNLLHNHILSPDLDARRPVIVMVYSHLSFLRKQRGLRRTHFQGYNVPSTFEMEDYSNIPPLEDFRRTIYWQPIVTTDANGKATVEFWNNSVATEIQVSCEGMTPHGKPLFY